MNNEIPKEFSSFMTPDSLRKTLQLLKSFYDNHTKKNVGYEDIEGSQYSGVIENFGSELLLESRKILMDLPSLKNIFISNTFDRYFDIQYSDLIDTYDQQSLLVATLTKDVLLSNKEYSIRFEDCSTKCVLRSESWSDPNVYKNTFIHTKTPPTLIIKDINNSNDIEEVPLILSKSADINTDYYFFINPLTESVILDYSNDVTVTKPITDNMYGLPFIWMGVDIFKLLPDIGLVNNVDLNNNSLLTFGTDGHGITRLYPLIYGSDNVPDNTKNSNWFIKVYAANNESFIPASNTINNYSTSISKVCFVCSENINSEPVAEQTITFDQSYSEIYLSNDVDWSFRTPRQGDYDFNGTTYENPCYAYININVFDTNTNNDPKTILKSAFVVKFDESYLHKFESICNNAVSGIHIDTSSEYSDNSVSKKNGVIYDLGDFDGLPKYFSYLLDRTIHRIHTEIYSIRDDLNNKNHKAIDKQTAALIFDSGIPQNEVSYVTDSLNTVIRYDGNRTYSEKEESVSPKNHLSEITFIDENTFGNENLPRNKFLKKFVYHGNRVFSLGMMGLDPELETARVYCVNNDPCEYENNDITKFKKAARSLCRICDIPTSFVQLINIEGLSPTLVIDSEYVRTEVPFTNKDNNELWNNKSPRLVTKNHMVYPYGGYVRDIVFGANDNLNNVIGGSYLSSNYYSMTNLNSSINIIGNDNCTLHMLNAGEGYSVNDEFNFIIGGLCFKGTVNKVDQGRITGFSYESTCDIQVNISNLDGRITELKTTTITGNGNGLRFQLIIDQTYWNMLQPQHGGILKDLYALKFDKFGNIWIWEYNNDSSIWEQKYQLTGTPIIENEYDDIKTQESRRLIDVFVKNTIIKNPDISDSVWLNDFNNDSCLNIKRIYSVIPVEFNVSSTTDQSYTIKGLNKQDRYYIPIENASETSPCHDVICIDRYDFTGDNRLSTLPRFHSMNLSNYCNKSNMLSYTFTDYQPLISYYNPFATDLYDFEKITNDIYEISNRHELTFADLFFKKDIDSIDEIIDKRTGILKRNIYEYNEYNMNTELSVLMDKLKTLTREELIDYIKQHFSSDVLPLKFEDTEYSYTEQMLIDYIMDNSYTSPVYKKEDIHVIRQQGDRVIQPVNNSYNGIGKQPTGLFLPVSTTNIKTDVFVDGYNQKSQSLLVLKVDCNPSEFGSINDMIVTDDNGNDVTNNTLLIYNGYMYIHKDNSGWIILN